LNAIPMHHQRLSTCQKPPVIIHPHPNPCHVLPGHIPSSFYDARGHHFMSFSPSHARPCLHRSQNVQLLSQSHPTNSHEHHRSETVSL
jgi:hypothetical protein